MILYFAGSVAFQIDDVDLEIVQHYSWSINVCGHPTTNTYRGGHKTWPLHVLLMGRAPKGLLWDHRDRDKLNNQRGNLRLVTPTISNRNKDCQANSETGLRGVHLYKGVTKDRWRVNMRIAGKLTHLGTFDTAEEAVAARKAAEDRVWGDAR